MPEEKPLFSVRFTLILAALLIGPLLVRHYTSSEPWPAVLLPSGGGLIRKYDGIALFEVVEVKAVDRSGKELRIDPQDLIDPIPPQYFRALSENRFGYDLTALRKVQTRSGKWVLYFPRKIPSLAERKEASRWLASRVRRKQRDYYKLSLRREVLSVEIGSGRELKRYRESETLVPLR